MKQIWTIGIFFLAGIAIVPSCTKNLKDDLSDIRKNIDSLKKVNEDLQHQQNNFESLIGSNEPIEVTTTFTDDNNATRTIAGTYSLKSAAQNSHRMVQNADGSYDITVSRFGELGRSQLVYTSFNYAPATGKVTQKWAIHYWVDMDPYNDAAEYYAGTQASPDCTVDITVSKFDPNTGDISFSCTAAATETYTTNAGQGSSPNPGKKMATNFAFTGKLVKLIRN